MQWETLRMDDVGCVSFAGPERREATDSEAELIPDQRQTMKN